MQLARDLHMTKSKLLAEIDSNEIADWLAFSLAEREMQEEEEERQKKKEEEQRQIVLREKFKAIMGGKLVKNEDTVGIEDKNGG